MYGERSADADRGKAMSEWNVIDELLSEKWKELLKLQLSSDADQQREANDRLSKAIRESEQGKNKDLWINEKDIPRLIQIGMTMHFPRPRAVFFSAEIEVLNWFWTVRHSHIAPAIESYYANADLSARMSALVILAAQRTSEASTILTRLVARAGFPEHMQPRFFWELNNCIEFVDVLLPQLLLNAGNQIGGVVDFINFVDAQGKLGSSHLQGADEVVEHRAREVFAIVEQMQRGSGSRWRYEEEYQEASIPLGAYLDLLGLMPASSLQLLHDATALSDPRLLLVAAVALVKRGLEPSRALLERIGASHAERLELYRILKNLGRPELFPQTFLSFESFAASHMGSWLAYPTELGYEPEVLELAATVRGTTEEGEKQWCLWRFADGDGKTYAGVSGPYESDPSIETMTSSDTFSNFTPWDEATPEQHLASITETLTSWRLHHCNK